MTSPDFERFRYLVHQIASAVLPAAGRIVDVDGDELTVSMGFRSRVETGQNLRILRYFDGRESRDLEEFASGGEYERLLPIRVMVTDVRNELLFGTRQLTGFEDVWPDDYRVRPGDIVLQNRPAREVTFIAKPVYRDPEKNSRIQKKIDNKTDYNRPKIEDVREQAFSLAGKIHVSLNDALSKLSVRSKVLPEIGGGSLDRISQVHQKRWGRNAARKAG